MLQHYLQKMWKSGRFPNSTIIAGADFQNSKNLLCSFIENVAINEHSLSSQNNPDVCVIEKDISQKSILIDQIRQLNIWVNQSSALTKNKFAIISQAELMSFSAVNACLKIIEEPNNNTYFFLTTNAPKTLPKTILSRCWLLYNTIQVDDLTYEPLLKSLLDEDIEQLQHLLSKRNIQISMKTILAKFLKSKILPDALLDEREIILFAKIKAQTLEQSIKIADQINEIINSHLTLSFDAKHISTLILSTLFLDE